MKDLEIIKDQVKESVQEAIYRWFDHVGSCKEGDIEKEVFDILNKRRKEIILSCLGITFDTWGRPKEFRPESALAKKLEQSPLAEKIESWLKTKVSYHIKREITKFAEKEISSSIRFSIERAVKDKFSRVIAKEIDKVSPENLIEELNSAYVKIKGNKNEKD